MICDVSKNRFLLIHVYPAVLLVLSAGYGTSVLNVKTNFHEGRWITGCALAMIPVLAVWLLACHFAPAEFHDAITAFAIILLASILLCVIFIPKLYTIVNRNRFYEKVSFLFICIPISVNFWPLKNCQVILHCMLLFSRATVQTRKCCIALVQIQLCTPLRTI